MTGNRSRYLPPADGERGSAGGQSICTQRRSKAFDLGGVMLGSGLICPPCALPCSCWPPDT
jgi:hypothetical protein